MAAWFFLSKKKREEKIQSIVENKFSQKKVKLDRELEQKKSELRLKENNVESKRREVGYTERILQRKEEEITKQEQRIESIRASVDSEKQKIREIKNDITAKLEEISGISKEEGKKIIMEDLQERLEKDKSRRLKEYSEEVQFQEKEIATNILANAIERYSGSVVSDRTTRNINLPNEDIKGKIIGKEGKNIRSIERVFGVNLVINEGASITVSCFNPLRREIAVRSLEALIRDGRINPTKIEDEQHKQAAEMHEFIIEKGKEAVYKMNIGRVSPEILESLGKLYFRTSYGQNNWLHAQEVGHLCGMMAAQLGLDQQLAKRCGILHDIGKARDFEIEGTHPAIGAKMAKQYGEKPEVVNAIAAHHGDVAVYSVYTPLTIAADRLSGALLGARNQSNENLIERLEAIESICNSFNGVKKSFAISAGREVRVIVEPDKVKEDEMYGIADSIKQRIEKELNYPGHIHISVIREKRYEVTAK